MKSITIRYQLSKEAIRDVFIATGNKLSAKQEKELVLAELTPEQRAVLYDAAFPEVWWGLDISEIGGKGNPPECWYIEPTISQIIGSAKILISMREAKVALQEKQRLREVEARERYAEIKEYCVKMLSGAKSSQAIADLRVPDEAEKLENELSIFGKDKLHYIMEEMYRAKVEQEYQEQKVAWIAQYGSDHLRLCVERGYSCDEAYVSQRTAKEFLGYDILGDAVWIRHPQPSHVGLLEAIRVSGEVVLMHRNKQDGLPEEAVIISGYLGKYSLFQVIPK